MKNLFTLVLVCLTFALTAQNVTFEPAKSLINENATASLNFDLAFLPEVADRDEAPEMEEVEDYFNIRFTSNPIFGDINIVYDLATTSDVTVEVLKGDYSVFSSSKDQVAGTQQTLWDENIGSGIHTIKIVANNKVELKRITL